MKRKKTAKISSVIEKVINCGFAYHKILADSGPIGRYWCFNLGCISQLKLICCIIRGIITENSKMSWIGEKNELDDLRIVTL